MRPGSPLPPATIEELDAHKGIFYTNRGVADWRFATSTGVEIVRARVGLRVNNGDMMRDAAIAGLGIALLPLFIAGPDIRDGRLKVVDLGVRPAPESSTLRIPRADAPRQNCARWQNI